jgi:putative acetyltransferase
MQILSTSENQPGIRPMPIVRIQRASSKNPDDAIELIEEYYEAIGVVARDDRAALLHYLSDPQIAIWVAYSGHAPVGCILYHPLPQIDSAGEMKRLYVRPAYRGFGVARLLLQTAEEFAKERQITWLYLDSKDDLFDAIAFYRRHGYRPCARYNDNPQATVFMRKRLSREVFVRSFRPGDEDAFRALNEAWIEKYFRLEEKDSQILNDPQSHVLAPGGQIFLAVKDGKIVGCCALLPLSNGSWEIAKMAVDESERGQGIGRQLMEYAIEYARDCSIRRLYIETNSALPNAIHLYESVGFRHIPVERVQRSPYVRANVFLEMILA